MGNYYSYQRISTKAERGLQKFDRQTKAIDKFVKESGKEILISFKEDVSGKNFTDRKEWQKLEKILQADDVVIMKDISRFTREAENGYTKYMELLEKGVELIFIDNPTISTPYIKELLRIAKEQSLVAKTSLESTVKLLLIVELDRVTQEREILIKRIKDGQKASSKKSGRPVGKLDKMSEELKADIEKFLSDRSIKQIDLMNKHSISRNTLKKYIEIVKNQ